MPSPLDVPAIQGVAVDNDETVIERHSSDEEPFSALAFKIMNDPFVGTSKQAPFLYWLSNKAFVLLVY